jgi:hypothetical protein
VSQVETPRDRLHLLQPLIPNKLPHEPLETCIGQADRILEMNTGSKPRTCLFELFDQGTDVDHSCLFIDHEGEYFAEMKGSSFFGRNVPEWREIRAADWDAFQYMTARAKLYYLPAYLLIAMNSPEEFPELAEQLLDSLTEPNFIPSDELLNFWSDVTRLDEGQQRCIATCVATLENFVGAEMELTNSEVEGKKRRDSYWSRYLSN